MPRTPVDYELPTIAGVGALDGDCIDMVLSNGHSILLELSERIHEPAFARLTQTHRSDLLKQTVSGFIGWTVPRLQWRIFLLCWPVAGMRKQKIKNNEQECNKHEKDLWVGFNLAFGAQSVCLRRR